MNRYEESVYWEKRVSEFKQSGMSISQWCQAQQLPQHKLRYRLKKEPTMIRSESCESSNEWIHLELPAKTEQPERKIRIQSQRITIELPETCNQELARALIHALEGF
jgi:hypothetical protein